MKKILYIFLLIPSILFAQEDKWKPFEDFDKKFKKAVKFATFYGAVNGNNSIADVDVYSINTGC